MTILLIIFTHYTKIWITKYGIEISNSTFRRCTFYSFSILIFYLQLICWGLHCYKALERNKVELMKWNFQEKAPLQFAESTPLTVSYNSSQRPSIKSGTRNIPEHAGTFRNIPEHPGTWKNKNNFHEKKYNKIIIK